MLSPSPRWFRVETDVMGITQVAPKARCATAVHKDFATNAALAMLPIILLEVLQTPELFAGDIHRLSCLFKNTGSWHMHALQLKPQNLHFVLM